MWECEECQIRKRQQWSARAVLGLGEITSSGTTPKFVTITSRPKYKDFAACAAAFPPAWNKFQARLRRCSTKSLMYLLIPERHKDGRLHAHFLTNAQVSQKWVKDNAYKSGFGYIANVQKVYGEAHVAAYVSKYIGKGLGEGELPHKFRRVRCSENWTPLAQLENHVASGDYDWLVCGTTISLWAATEQCQRENRSMVDAQTGEFFDYGEAAERLSS